MDVVYKPKHDVVYITLRHATVAHRQQVEGGNLVLNYDEDGELAGLEVHQASERTSNPRRIQTAVGL